MTITITNGTLTQIQETLSPSSGYSLPSSISVTGATSTYSDVTGQVVLTSLTSSVEIEAEAVESKRFFFGTSEVEKVLFGESEVTKIYMGDTLIYSYTPTPSGYEIGFRGMSSSTPALTRTGSAVGATWAATSGVISIDGIDITKIFGGYVGNDGEELTWDSANSVYKNGSTTYTGNVFVKINRFFCKAYYENNVLDGFDLYFGSEAPDATYQDWFLGKDHCIIGCYKARDDGGVSAFANGLQSKQGLSYTGSTTADDIVTAYKLNSSTAYSLHEKWYNENAILQVLFMAIFATRQTEDVFPQATYRNYSSDTRATGYMDSYRASSLFAYEPTGESGHRGNMFLGIEDFVGWGYELVAGVVISNKTRVNLSMDYANFVYTGIYTTSSCSLPSESGNIQELQSDDTNIGLLVPKVASGTDYTQYFCDRIYVSGGESHAWYQGANSPTSGSGVFFFNENFGHTEPYNYFAARLCGIPL